MSILLTVAFVGYGTVGVAGDTFDHTSGPKQQAFTTYVQNGQTYSLNYIGLPDFSYIFSRYQVVRGCTIAAPTLPSTTITINTVGDVYITVFTKSLFYTQLQGDGTITVSNPGNPADSGTTLTVSGYNAIGSEYFEQSASSTPYSLLTCTYTSTVAGYSFNKWLGSELVTNPTINPGTYYYTVLGGSNSSTDPLICVTNVALTVVQTTGGSIKSSPAGIITSDAALGPVTASFEYGTNITLTPTPALRHSFLYWITPTGNRQQRSLPITITAVETVTGVFAQNIVHPVPLNYSPNQSERADSMHICECPCDCTCLPAFTSALNRTRQIRALISGSCCRYTPVTIAIINPGTDYTTDTILQLQGGTPLEKAALFKVTGVDGSGGITSIVPLYGQPYRQKPTDIILTVYTGPGSGATFTISWDECPSSANLYRQ